MAVQSESFLNTGALDWSSAQNPLLAHKINKFKPLMSRVDVEQIEKMINESKQDAGMRVK